MTDRSFAQSLRYLDAQAALGDATLRRQARELEQEYGRTTARSVHSANRNKLRFFDFLDWQRVVNGQDAALAALDRYFAAGLTPEARAHAINHLTLRSGDFDARYEALARAAGESPDSDYVLHVYLQAALAAGRLDAVEAGLARALERAGTLDDARRLQFSEVAAQSGLWAQAARLSPAPGTSGAAALLSRRIELASRFAPEGHAGTAVHMINLPRDARRFRLARALFARMGLDVRRFEGVDGAGLAPGARSAALNPAAGSLGAGIVGCALSHIGVWRAVAEGRDDFALVLEDDAIPYSWQRVDELVARHPAVDLLFVNERMSSTHVPGLTTESSPVWDVLGRWPEKSNGWGLDGYILTRRGAERLVSAVDADRIIGHIDGQAGSYCVPDGLEPRTRAQGIAQTVRSHMRSGLLLDAAALNFPVVKQQAFGTSTIASVTAGR